jgi:hypothetical protein
VSRNTSPHLIAPKYTKDTIGRESDSSTKAAEMKGITPNYTASHQSSSERAMGFEPTTASLEGSTQTTRKKAGQPCFLVF